MTTTIGVKDIITYERVLSALYRVRSISPMADGANPVAVLQDYIQQTERAAQHAAKN